MSKISKKLYKYQITLTETGGVSEILKNECILLFKKSKYHLLVEEGGEGTNSHYHLHGILESTHKRTSNLRDCVFKPLYKRLGIPMYAITVKIQTIKGLEGSLSYIMKKNRVLTSNSIMLETVKKWVDKPKPNNLKGFTSVGRHNYVTLVTAFCDKKGITPTNWPDIRNVMADMVDEKYMFGYGNWSKEVVSKVLQYYGDSTYVLSHWDFSCNIPS